MKLEPEYEFRNRKPYKKDKIDWLYWAIGIVAIGVFMDIGVATTNYCLITVTESYMDYVYSAIVTISVLNFTLIALLSGMLSTRYYGYELKDILGFKNAPVNLKKFISVSLIYIVVATVVLLLSFIIDSVNTLIFLLFSMVYIILHTGLKIYEITTNEEYCLGIVKNYYETIQVKNKINYNLFKFHLNKLSVALEIAIKEQSKEDKDKILEMICKLCAFMKKQNKEYYDYFNYLNSVMKKYIVDFSLHFGYNEMLRYLVTLYSVVSDNQFVRNDFFILPLKEMEFYDDRTLQNLNYLDEIMDFDLLDEYKENKIKDEEIQKILYNYFLALLKNQLCSTNCKNKMITDYIYKLSRFTRNSDEKQVLLVEQIALLNVLKYFIIKNENSSERKFIFEELVKNTFINNNYNTSKTYYNCLSIIFQVFYAYIILEQETLNQNYRENIKKLFQTDITTPNIVPLNLATLIKMNIEGVICAIACRIEKEDEFTRTFEYFPPYMMAKSVIWTEVFNIKFMFLVFMVYNYEVGFYSLYERFFQWKKMNISAKLKILNEFMSFFEKNTGVLKRDIINEIEELADLMQYNRFSVNKNKQIKLFEHIRKEHEKLFLENVKEREIPELDLKDIKQQLNELMKQENVFGWSADYYDDFYVKYSTPDYICRKEHIDNRSVARSIQMACLSAINNYINSSTNELELSFDEQGIKKMLEFLNNCEYDCKNYTFTNDLAFSKELRESSGFEEIIKKNNLIEDVDTRKINSYIYFHKDNFSFNIKISHYKCLDLTDEECVEYIENSKAYSGLYNVDGALMAKDKAINTVKNLFCRQRIVFKLMVSFKHNDVTHIKFKH